MLGGSRAVSSWGSNLVCTFFSPQPRPLPSHSPTDYPRPNASTVAVWAEPYHGRGLRTGSKHSATDPIFLRAGCHPFRHAAARLRYTLVRVSSPLGPISLTYCTRQRLLIPSFLSLPPLSHWCSEVEGRAVVTDHGHGCDCLKRYVPHVNHLHERRPW